MSKELRYRSIKEILSLLDNSKKINKTPNDNDKFTFSGYRTYPKYLDKLLISHLENMTNRRAG